MNKKILNSLVFSFVILCSACASNTQIVSEHSLPDAFKKYDTNKDNLISGAELTEDLKRFDIDGDGILRPSEILFMQSKEKFESQNPNYKEPFFTHPKIKDAPKQNFKNTILISIDGMDRAVLKEMFEAKRLPNLSAIAKQFSDSEFVIHVNLIDHQTETKPGHAVMLTGLNSERNKVLTNSQFSAIPKGLTIFERLEDSQGKDNIQTIFVSSKEGNVGKPYAIAKESIDIFSATDKEPAEALKVFVEALKETKDKTFFGFLHFRNPDRQGHKFGRETKEYREGAEEVDKQIGELLHFLQANNIFENTRLLITADHGFNPNEKHHHFAPWIFLITNDVSLFTTKTIKDYDTPATILDCFPLKASKKYNDLSGTSLIKN